MKAKRTEARKTTLRKRTVPVKDITERKNAELERTQIESLFKLVFDNSSDLLALIRVDPERGFTLAAINRKYLRLARQFKPEITESDFLGRTREDVLLRVFGIDPVLVDQETRRYRQVHESLETMRYEEVLVFGTQRFHADVVLAPVLDEKGVCRYLLWSSRDMTERQKAQEVLRQNEEYYRLLFENSYDVVVALDKHGSAKFISPSTRRFSGFDPEELHGKNGSEVIHPEDRDKAWASFSECLRTPGIQPPVEIRFRQKDGTYSWVEVTANNLLDNPAIQAVIVNHHDITERNKAEAALAESEESYRKLADNLPGIVYRLDLTKQGHMTFFNEQLEPLTGYVPEELHHGEVCSIDPLILPADRIQVIAEVKQAMRERRSFSVEYRLRHKDGSIRHFIERGTPVVGADGKPMHIDGVIFDLTEKRKAEEERTRIEAEFHQAQKMEVVGLLAGGIAHDFNNILLVVMNYAEIMLRKLPPGHELRTEVNEIRAAAEKAEVLTDQLLGFSRKQKRKPQRLDVNRVVSDVAKMIRSLLGHSVQLEVAIDALEGFLIMDPSQLEQILLNLAVNAKDAMPNGGKLVIETRDVVLDEMRLTPYPDVAPGEYVQIRITDTGAGMDAEILDRIFEPFFTTKVKGTGLGLPVVGGIVKQNRGHIEVESHPGKGTTFRLFFRKADRAKP